MKSGGSFVDVAGMMSRTMIAKLPIFAAIRK
jgi:hypothetical protein